MKNKENPFIKYFSEDRLKRLEVQLNNLICIFRKDNSDNFIVKYKKQFELEDNHYQNLYKYISEEALKIGMKNILTYLNLIKIKKKLLMI